ncbi:MAG: S41 family peptidase [Bacteroidaceae bacterium]|nr:S41 family peptidase [Bacteroidaceae bacterium]MBP3613603.1 S41 family peptidase [Bacteroidaceae bacterium]
MRRRIPFIVFPLAVLSILTLLAFSNDRRKFNLSQQLNIFNTIIKELDLFYVDTIAPDKLIKNGVDAMLSRLDPYTVYYSEDDADELKMMITGKYAGIGSIIRYHTDKKTTVIAEPYDNMPAAKAGLKCGDALLTVDGIDVKGMSTDSVSNLLRGEPGTKLKLEIERPGVKKPMSVIIERASISLPSLPYYGILHDSIGYILFDSFTENCAKEMRRAIVDLKGRGAKSFIIDLRGNGGGSLQESVNIVNLFVPKGKTIVTTKGKIKQANEEYKTTREPMDTESPLIILVDGSTASASEILAGSLQDFDRAVIVGSRTYGKGLVQTTRSLPGNGYLKLTTSKYYIPSGRCVQALDYSHRKSDGTVQRIPDSLTNVFHTAAGREVRDGGGIRPDVEPKSEELSTLLFYLMQDMTIFDYATEYTLRNDTIAPAATFEISDADYELFKKKLIASGFSYDMRSSKMLKQLKEMIKFEGYEEITKDDIASLEGKLQQNLGHSLEHFASHIKRLIGDEIVKRYYGQKGGVVYNLRDDTDIEEAFKILSDGERYKKILAPQQNEDI